MIAVVLAGIAVIGYGLITFPEFVGYVVLGCGPVIALSVIMGLRDL